MKRHTFATFFLAATFSGSMASALKAAAPIEKDDFEKLHQLMQPQKSELAWRQIQWHSTIWDARREAAKVGKPVYLWEMDGHPLGCT